MYHSQPSWRWRRNQQFKSRLFKGNNCSLGVCVAILGLWWGLQWSGMVDMPIPDGYEIGWRKKTVSGVIFGVEYLILAMKTKVLGEMAFCGVYVWPFWLWLGPQWLWMVDMQLQDRCVIGWKTVSWVIFGMEYLIWATKTKVLGEMAFCGVYIWPFWGSDGAPDG